MRAPALLVLILLVVIACDEPAAKPAPPAIDAGPKPQRVVSLSPSTTEAMFALDAAELLVGRSSHCDFPAAAKQLPSVGGFADPNIESIVALRPSLVIGSQGPAGPNLARRLRDHGIDTLFPATDSIAGVTAMLVQLGERFDRGDRARRASSAIDARVAAIRSWAAERERITTVVVFDISPLYVAGPGSFTDELLRLASADNVIKRGGKWPTIDVERLLSLNPDVIIDAQDVDHERTGRSRLPDAPGWSELRAVKDKRVRRLHTDTALRPGPRIAQGLADVARAVHGEAPP